MPNKKKFSIFNCFKKICFFNIRPNGVDKRNRLFSLANFQSSKVAFKLQKSYVDKKIGLLDRVTQVRHEIKAMDQPDHVIKFL